jgi:hypothetical protein
VRRSGCSRGNLDFEARKIQVARGISAGKVETPKSGKSRSVDMSIALRDVRRRHEAAAKAAALKGGSERAP